MKQLKRLIYYYRIKAAIKHAERMHLQTHKQFFVIKIFNKIRVYDRLHINMLVDAGVLDRRMREFYTLQKYCIYITK